MTTPQPKSSDVLPALLDDEEIAAIIACLGDDAAQLRDANSEDERADNMDAAASLIEKLCVALAIAAQKAAPAGEAHRLNALLMRAAELHEKAGMAWADSEELALAEVGIDSAAVDELIGECGNAGLESLLVTGDELRQFTRSVLVHQPRIVNPQPLSNAEKRDLIDSSGFITGPNFETPTGRLYRSLGVASNVWEYDLFELIDRAQGITTKENT